MSVHRVPAGKRAEVLAVVRDIIEGEPWTARLIRNNNLRQHCRILARVFQKQESWLIKDDLFSRSLQSCLSRLVTVLAEHSCLFTAWHPDEMQIIPALLRLSSYSKVWIREPGDWTPPADCVAPRAQWEHFLHHLLCEWPLPRCFASAWETFGDLFHVERDWYIHAARGRSMREAEAMPATVSNRALHFMMQAPDHLTVRQAMRWGQATAAGCSETLREECLTSSMANDLSHDFIWSRLLQKAAACHAAPGQWSLLSDGMLLNIRHDGYRKAARLVDMPWGALLHHCRAQFERLLHGCQEAGMNVGPEHLEHAARREELVHISATKWKPFLGEDTDDRTQHITATADDVWVMRELTTLTQLIAEGQRLRHCVASYGKWCQRGDSALFSLRCGHPSQDESEYRRVLTIEVDRLTRRILQVKGKWNRRSQEAEWPVLNKWAEMNELRWE